MAPDDHGPSPVPRQRLGTVFAALVGLMTLVFAVALWISREINDRSKERYIGRVLPLRTGIRDLEVAMLNQETGVRGFLITGEASSLEPYEFGRRDVRRALGVVREYIDEAPGIRGLVDTEADQVDELETYFAEQIALVSSGPNGLAAARARVDDGMVLFDRFRVTAASLDTERERLTDRAVRDQDRLTNQLTWLLIAFGGSAVAIAIGLSLRVPRRIMALVDDLSEARDRDRASRAAAELREAKSSFLAALSKALDQTDGATERLACAVASLGSAVTGFVAIVHVQRDGTVEALAVEGEPPVTQAMLSAALEPIGGHDDVGALIRQVAEQRRGASTSIATPSAARNVVESDDGGSVVPEAFDVVAVPLPAAGSTTVLLIGASTVDGPFGEPDLPFVEDIAGRIGLAVENARLLDEQRSLARVLQEGLLPKELPTIPGMDVAACYRPAASHSAVGGDFYDVYSAGDGWYVIVGDVCGKGPEAAQLTALVRHTLRTAAVTDPTASPTRLLEILNQAVLDQTDPSEYCTVVCARLERLSDHEHSLRVATGGHPPPFVRRRNGTVIDLSPRGSLVGVFADATFDEVTVDLADGDTLLCYTDGAIEARRGGHFFGGERLRAALTAAKQSRATGIVESIEASVVAFAEDGELQDDLVLVAVRTDTRPFEM